jgi:multiple sugar transport system ATP-binding protein
LYLKSKTQTLIARTEPENKFQVGDTANFSPLMEKTKFFDKDTEGNICEVVKSE